ncbi:hypothetical protein WSM22_37450 [Cytophagales bacterium WSM2-2]|nr:hypothetical protein WSM22_37450 [Cytophagales bacterium WSM2-2]
MLVSAFNEIDMLPLFSRLEEEYDDFEKGFAGVELMPFFIKTVCSALKRFPRINTNQDPTRILIEYSSKKVTLHKSDQLHNIDDIRNTLVEELQRKKADLSKDLSTETTFSIVCNSSEHQTLAWVVSESVTHSCKLTLYQIEKRPLVIDRTRVESRPLMYISLSYPPSHISTEEAKAFLLCVKEGVESQE